MIYIKKQLKKTDKFRRRITKSIVYNFDFTRKEQANSKLDPQVVKRVLICRPNHRLGNQLLISPLIQEVADTFPKAKIDLFLKGGLGPILFESYPMINELILLPKNHFKNFGSYITSWIKLKNKKYDLIINAKAGSSSGRLSASLPKTNFRILADELPITSIKDQLHFGKESIYQFRDFLKVSEINREHLPIPLLDIKLTPSEIKKGKELVSQITKSNKPSIGIYTFATAQKCYETEEWLAFYEQLKSDYASEYNIVEILPIENISKINFSAPHVYSKNLRELAAMMHATELFISGDCGMMHLGSAAQTTVLGLFKFDNMPRYQPYGNNSLGIHSEDLKEDDLRTTINNLLRNSHKHSERNIIS